MEKVLEIYIKTTPERLWKAIVDEEMRSKYSFGLRVRSSWAAGSRYAASHPGAPGFLLEGKNLRRRRRRPGGRGREARGNLEGHLGNRAGRQLVPADPVTHDQLRQGAHDELYGGWPMILSGLKTLLETGELLETPGSQRYAEPSRYSRIRGLRPASLAGAALQPGAPRQPTSAGAPSLRAFLTASRSRAVLTTPRPSSPVPIAPPRQLAPPCPRTAGADLGASRPT